VVPQPDPQDEGQEGDERLGVVPAEDPEVGIS
jgi:hypothetical protein